MSSYSDTNDKGLVIANFIKEQDDIDLPALSLFNSDPCSSHCSIEEGNAVFCSKCGVVLRRHQRIATAWLYFKKNGLLAYPVGTGKTASAAGLMALMAENDGLGKILVICRAAATQQWVTELNRFLPSFSVILATGTKSKRLDLYSRPWNVCVTSYQTLVQDLEALLNFNFQLMVVDDVDTLRNRDNRSAYAIKRVSRQAGRSVLLTATPMHKRLSEMYSVLEVVGGREVFGSSKSFSDRYIRKNSGSVEQYKNMDEFKSKIGPLYLRKTVDEIDDIDLPAIIPNTVYIDLYPLQADKYEELRQGVLRIMREQGETIKRADAMAKFTYGQQICSGLVTIGEEDRPMTSSKLDWIDDNFLSDSDILDEKIVVFMRFKNTVRALQERLRRRGILFETIWGEVTNKQARENSKIRFTKDPECKVLLGTESIEQSLNLQAARHLIAVDTILNPARMTQLSGRVRRAGSSHKTVYVHTLLTTDTQEQNYMSKLEREQAISDFVWGEQNDMYAPLSSIELLQLIGPSTRIST